jgi:hypothetical protein
MTLAFGKWIPHEELVISSKMEHASAMKDDPFTSKKFYSNSDPFNEILVIQM